MSKLIFISILFVTNIAYCKYKISFFYQPHENAGVDCSFVESGQPHGYLVECGSKKFQVHHFARPFLNQDNLSWEVLYWVTNIRSNLGNEHTGTTLWIKSDPKSEIQIIKLGQAVDNDTATLDLTIYLPRDFNSNSSD